MKEPTILQSFSPSPSFLGNPDLEPERATTVDAGIEQRLFGQRLKMEAVWFNGRYRNISFDAHDELHAVPVAAFQHRLDQSARGAELPVEAAPAAAMRIRGGYTLTISRIAESTSPTNPVFAVGAWAFRRPRHSGFMEGIWTLDRFSADLRGTFIGRRVDSDFSSLVPPIIENSDYAAWDAGASYHVAVPVTRLFPALRISAIADYMDSARLSRVATDGTRRRETRVVKPRAAISWSGGQGLLHARCSARTTITTLPPW